MIRLRQPYSNLLEIAIRAVLSLFERKPAEGVRREIRVHLQYGLNITQASFHLCVQKEEGKAEEVLKEGD